MTTEHISIHNPIVIIGMHRSGTSLLARMLSACGVFMGDDVQGDHESQIFMRLNDTLFLLCYATWSNPFSIHLALGKDQTVQELTHVASQILSSYAYRNDPELVTFAQRWKRILAEHGYEA